MNDQPAQLAERLLSLLPADGARRGNTALRRELGCGEDDYWRARSLLLDDGKVARARGRGGSVRLLVDVDGAPAEPNALQGDTSTAEAVYRREPDLYEPVRAVVERSWAIERRENAVEGGADSVVTASVTGYQGRRRTGGVWSRPDIVCVSGNVWPHVPGRHLEVVTFEVKPDGILDVRAIYEALSHRRVGTHAYALFHIPPGGRSDAWRDTDLLDEVVTVGRAHGVGVITVEDPSDFATWDELVEAEHAQPDPKTLDTFIKTQLSPEVKAAITRWVGH